METTTAIYKKYMFMYGILSVLFVMEHFESIENYEECQKILDAIKQQEKLLGCKLPTRRIELKVKEVIDAYKKFNLTGKNHLENSKYYSKLILNDISC